MVLLLAPAVALAAWPDGTEWTRQAEVTGLARVVRRGVVLADEVVRPAFWFASESLKMGAWLDLPLQTAREREFAFTARYSRTFEGGAALALGAAYFNRRNSPAGYPEDAPELTLTVAQPAGPGRVEGVYTRDMRRRADIGELAYSGDWALKSLGAFLNYRFYLGTARAREVLSGGSGPAAADSYAYHGADLTLPYRIGGATVLTVGLHFAGTRGQRPHWSPIAIRPGGKLWFTLAATREF
ncbi:MAG: hypothetical protein C0502_10370 [Opitutus sp.]|nr:hypothetical protein [Opitutus sp.]